ncbi:MAG: tRNA(Ile)-lysidine synthetase, N-terminal domain protein [Acidobacteria bacterium]|nr:tRNA(Ile)-lysidine synthetase, N-terminal domain protein [Acidobacteriota bacterium]
MKNLSPKSQSAKRVRPVRSSRAKTSAFARRLLNAWRDLQLPFLQTTVVVAVSGGADSTTLLLALDELIAAREMQIHLIVAHLDHGLRPQSKADAEWVAKLAGKLGHQTRIGRVNVGKRAKTTRDNLEQAARQARYEFLLKTARTANAELILTAHTLDDQAETILLRLLRGAGAEGLTGIDPVRPLVTQTVSLRERLSGRDLAEPNSAHHSTSSDLLLARPLLTWARRAETEAYCRLRKIDYRSDPMNDDEHFARVRVRKQLLPLMASFNGKVVEALARTAELLRDDLSVLNQQAGLLLLEATAGHKGETKVPSLNVSVLADAPAAVRRRALRQWLSQGRGDLRRIELLHIVGIEKLLLGDKGGRVAELPGGARVVRKQKRLELIVKRRPNSAGEQSENVR